MATTVRPRISERNKYWIDKHRYYELKHFCLQYSIWKKAYAAIDELNHRSVDSVTYSKTNTVSDPTSKCVEAKLFYSERIEMIERAAMEADEGLSMYIIKAVTEGMSYDYLKVRLEIPCSKDTYYDLYRRFFWLLSRTRN